MAVAHLNSALYTSQLATPITMSKNGKADPGRVAKVVSGTVAVTTAYTSDAGDTIKLCRLPANGHADGDIGFKIEYSLPA